MPGEERASKRREKARAERPVALADDLAADARPEPAAGRLGALEARLRRAAAPLSRPAIHLAAVAVLLLVGILVRIPPALDEEGYFRHHADESQYFNRAWVEFPNADALGGRHPLPHGGSGLPLVVEQALSSSGVEPGALPSATDPDGDYVSQFGALELSPAQLAAARTAYVFNALASGGVLVATLLLARQLLPPLGVLAALFLVAFDPLLIDLGGQFMTEPIFTACLVFALAAVVKARERPAWLLAAAPPMALAAMLRVNGIVMLVMVMAFAVLYLRRHARRFQWRHVAAAVAVFFLLLAPYLSWRADDLPGAFDYGTNQRFWADNLWDFSRNETTGIRNDPYWRDYTVAGGGPRETPADYFAKHSLGDAATRLYQSVQWQLLDLFGPGADPARFAQGAALTPFLVVPLAAGLARFPHRREFWFVPLGIAFTLATFVWIYPIVRSVRYYAPLVPLVAILAVAGLAWLALRSRRPFTLGAAYLGLFAAVHAVEPVRRLAGLAGAAGLWGLVAFMVVLWLAVAFAGPARRWLADRRGRRHGA